MRLFVPALIWMTLLLPAMADPAPVRVAVISDVDNRDLAALVTTELSSNPEISLVERDDLAKIGDEAKLQQLAGGDAVALGKLAGADGLLFLDQRTDGAHVRFTAVNLGYALFDDPVPAGTDPTQEAKAIAHLVVNDAAKLTLDPLKAIPISVLNLRADYATTGALELERNLTLLVESQLAAVPAYVVLERRHAWSLGFERSLDSSPKPLAEGAYIVDGTFELLSPGAANVTIHLRVRPPHGGAIETNITGAPNSLPELAQKIVAQIQKDTGQNPSAPEWHPESEAREYLLEGIWAWQHKATQESMEALDSAELLGEKAPELIKARISNLCTMAGADLDIENGHIILPSGPTAISVDRRTDLILHALDETVDFQKATEDASIPPAPPEVQQAD